MPITFKVKNENNYFISVWEGSISDDEIYESYKKFYTSNEWSKNLNELVDLSNANVENITGRGLTRLAKYVENHFAMHKVTSSKTSVYSPNDIAFGLARVYEAWTSESPEEIRVFRNEKEALNWLDNNI